MKWLLGMLIIASAHAHETLTTTVLFDREIVRIVNKHCVMCHAMGGPSFPLETYEQTWIAGRKIRAAAVARHMPPWAAFPGYGQFANENSLTLRELQFVVSWVEGLGPRNAGTVFRNLAGGDADRPKEVRASVDFEHWQLGPPPIVRQLPATVMEAGQPDQIKRIVISGGSAKEQRIRAIEFHPGDRRVVRAAFFTIQETGQWIGSWTPWYGFANAPNGSYFRLPGGAHIVAEIHYRGAKERITDGGTLGLFPAEADAREQMSQMVLTASGAATTLRTQARIASDTSVTALRIEPPAGTKSLEVSARTPDGGTRVLFFAREFPAAWPSPYIFQEPVVLPGGSVLAVTAHTSEPGTVRLTVSGISTTRR